MGRRTPATAILPTYFPFMSLKILLSLLPSSLPKFFPTCSPDPSSRTLLLLPGIFLRPSFSACCCVEHLKATVGSSSRKYLSHFSPTSRGTRSEVWGEDVGESLAPGPRGALGGYVIMTHTNSKYLHAEAQRE